MAPTRLLGLLLLLLVCLSYVRSGETKKRIKIHVPYYVKHVHHYKKVYVPKVQVVKHEHLHKKEHEHHHHHDHGHHHHHSGYDKSDGGHKSQEYDSYYDDIGHRIYNEHTPQANRLPNSRNKKQYRESWQDDRTSEEISSQELTSSEEDDYISDEDDGQRGTLPAPTVMSRYRPPTLATKRPQFQRIVRRKVAIVPKKDKTILHISPIAKTLPRRVITTVTT